MAAVEPKLVKVLTFFAGLFWTYAGLSKAAHMLIATSGSDEESVPTLWADSFPTSVIVAVLVLEVFAGLAFLTRRPTVALLMVAVLLCGFTATLWISPPDAGQSCGCLGSTPTPRWLSPSSAIILTGGLHAILAASVLPPPAAWRVGRTMSK